MSPRRHTAPLSLQGRFALHVLALNIKRLRQARGLSQTQLARLAHYADHTAISRLETGRLLPSTRHLLALADALHVPISDLWRDPSA